jgi:hypothetical protein
MFFKLVKSEQFFFFFFVYIDLSYFVFWGLELVPYVNDCLKLFETSMKC